MQEMNLDVAGEFLVMAATLIHIKSRTLLPRPDPSQEDAGPEEDPREALVRRLLEHQKYKAAAELLHDRETLRGAQFSAPRRERGRGSGRTPTSRSSRSICSRLMSAFRGVLERASRRPRMVLPPDQISIEDRIQQLLGAACRRPRRAASKTCSPTATAHASFMIVTFLALLEMIRLKLIRVFQTGGFGPIRVYKRARPADAPHPIGDPQTLEPCQTKPQATETRHGEHR